MPEFIMDKSGHVDVARKWQTEIIREGFKGDMHWRDLPEGARGYLEAAYFTDACNPDAEGYDAFIAEHGEPSFRHLTPESLAAALEDWTAFEAKVRPLLAQAYEREGYDETRAGHDFWYTRNGHGVGFWDRDELRRGGLGETLSRVAQNFRERYVTLEPESGRVVIE